MCLSLKMYFFCQNICTIQKNVVLLQRNPRQSLTQVKLSGVVFIVPLRSKSVTKVLLFYDMHKFLGKNLQNLLYLHLKSSILEISKLSLFFEQGTSGSLLGLRRNPSLSAKENRKIAHFGRFFYFYLHICNFFCNFAR